MASGMAGTSCGVADVRVTKRVVVRVLKRVGLMVMVVQDSVEHEEGRVEEADVGATVVEGVEVIDETEGVVMMVVSTVEVE